MLNSHVQFKCLGYKFNSKVVVCQMLNSSLVQKYYFMWLKVVFTIHSTSSLFMVHHSLHFDDYFHLLKLVCWMNISLFCKWSSLLMLPLFMNVMFKTYGRMIMTLTIFDWVVLIAICLDFKYFNLHRQQNRKKNQERNNDKKNWKRENKRKLNGRIETTTLLRWTNLATMKHTSNERTLLRIF